MTKTCIEVAFAQDVYKSDTLDQSAIVGFFVAFVVTGVIVILITKYVFQQLNKEQERQRYVEKLKRDGTYRRSALNRHGDDEEDYDLDSNSPLQTNYVYISPEQSNLSRSVNRDHCKPEHASLCSKSNQENFPVLNETGSLQKEIGLLSTQQHSSLFSGSFLVSSSTQSTQNGCDVREMGNVLGLCDPNDVEFPVQDGILYCRCRPSAKETSLLLRRFHETKLAGIKSIISYLLSYCGANKLIAETVRLDLLSRCEQQMFEFPIFSNDSSQEFKIIRNILRDIYSKVQQSTRDEEIDGACLLKATTKCIELLNLKLTETFTDYFMNISNLIVNEEFKLTERITERWKTIELARARIDFVTAHCEQLLEHMGNDKRPVQEKIWSHYQELSVAISNLSASFERKFLDFYNSISSRHQELCNILVFYLQSQWDDEFKVINDKDSIDIVLTNYTYACIKLLDTQLETELKEAENFNAIQFKELKKIELAGRKQVNEILKESEDKLFDNLMTEGILKEEDVRECGKSITTSLKEFKTNLEDKKHNFIQIIGEELSCVSQSMKAYLTLILNRSTQEYKLSSFVSDRTLRSITFHKFSGSKDNQMLQTCSRLLQAIQFSDLQMQFFCHSASVLASSVNCIATNSFVNDTSYGLQQLATKLSQLNIKDPFVIPSPRFFQNISTSMAERMTRLLTTQEDVIRKIWIDYDYLMKQCIFPVAIRNRLGICHQVIALHKVLIRITDHEKDSNGISKKDRKVSSVRKRSLKNGDAILTTDDVLEVFSSQTRMYEYKFQEEIKAEETKKTKDKKSYVKTLCDISNCTLSSTDADIEQKYVEEKRTTNPKKISSTSLDENAQIDLIPSDLQQIFGLELKAVSDVGTFLDNHLRASRLDFAVYQRFVIDKFLEKVIGPSEQTGDSGNHEETPKKRDARDIAVASDKLKDRSTNEEARDNERKNSKPQPKFSVLKSLKKQNKCAASIDRKNTLQEKKPTSQQPKRIKSQRRSQVSSIN